jgi:hypothetical protein
MKIKKNLKFLLLILFILIVFCILYFNNFFKNENYGFSSMKFKHFNLYDSRVIGTKIIYTYYSDDGEFLKINVKNFSNYKSANQFINLSRIQTDSLFETHISPYPGQISNAIECQKDYLPIPNYFFEDNKSNFDRFYFLTYASERFGLGVCVDDLIKYKLLEGWIVCENDNYNDMIDDNKFSVYNIRYFAKRKNDDYSSQINFFQNLLC